MADFSRGKFWYHFYSFFFHFAVTAAILPDNKNVTSDSKVTVVTAKWQKCGRNWVDAESA